MRLTAMRPAAEVGLGLKSAWRLSRPTGLPAHTKPSSPSRKSRRLLSSRFDQAAFTLVEVLVVASLIGLVAALAIRPVEDAIRGVLRVRRDAAASTSTLTVLESLARDIRAATIVKECDSNRILLGGMNDEGDITWQFDQTSVERTSSSGATPFQTTITGLQIVPDTQPPATRYILIRGRFEGLGYIERGIAHRNGR